MKITQNNILLIVIAVLVVVVLFKGCDETKTVTKTVTKIVQKHDTIRTVEIKEVPKIVYVNKTVDKKGEKVIVYVDRKTDSETIEANQYTSKVESNEAVANLKITTTGELLDVQGVISYPEKTVTKTITKTKPKSGLFIYGLVPVNANQANVEVGLSYQIKNKIMIMGGVQYNDFTNSVDFKVGIGVKLF